MTGLPRTSRIEGVPALKTPVDVATAVWRPVTLRAAAALAFGALSIFWPAPGASTVAYCLALFLIVSAKAVWDFAKAPVIPEGVRGLLVAPAAVWLLAAVVLVISPETATIGIAGGLAFLLSGALELAGWFRSRRDLVPARDLAITGAVSLGTGVGLLGGLNLGLDAHGFFGIAGGGAILTGVFLLIAGLGYRYDARSTDARR